MFINSNINDSIKYLVLEISGMAKLPKGISITRSQGKFVEKHVDIESIFSLF